MDSMNRRLARLLLLSHLGRARIEISSEAYVTILDLITEIISVPLEQEQANADA